MKFLTLPEVKAHLKVTSAVEDALITLYVSAAEDNCIKYLNRDVYESQAALEEAVTDENPGRDPMVISASTKAAILLLVGHLYEGRQDITSESQFVAIPKNSRWLLWPDRILPGV